MQSESTSRAARGAIINPEKRSPGKPYQLKVTLFTQLVKGIVSKALAGPTHLCTLPGIQSASEAVKGRCC